MAVTETGSVYDSEVSKVNVMIEMEVELPSMWQIIFVLSHVLIYRPLNTNVD